jgi:hypothetical protein
MRVPDQNPQKQAEWGEILDKNAIPKPSSLIFTKNHNKYKV